MSDTRTITLGGTGFAVPALPFRINRQAYPLCRKLTAANLIERALAANGALDCSADEMDDLGELAFLAASAADKALTRAAFDELPIAPPQLLDAFFAIRYQTGAWVAQEAGAEPEAGEILGA